jgi:hypothetical protein
MNERRRSPRTRTLRAGKILFNNRRSVIDCMVRNVSRAGACLVVPSLVGVPPEFDLVISGEAASHACRMIWHAENRIGVEFTGA